MNPALTILFLLLTTAAIAADSPQRVLEKHGLKHVNGLWFAAQEAQITDRVQAIERLERRVRDLGKLVNQLLAQNELKKTQLANQNAALKILQEARKSAKGGSPEQKQLDEQIKKTTALVEEIKKSIVPLEKLGAVAPTKGAAMELVAVRLELALHILNARRQIEKAPKVYESLRKNSDVTAALAALEPPGQLAPPRAYTNEQRVLTRVEKLVLNDELPLYREGKQLRVTAIANEELPITLSYYDKDEPAVITHTMAESLGIALDGKQPKATRLDGGHNVQAKPARLASLRFGRHLLANIEVLVLAPEQENLGARIGRSALKNLRVQVAPERLLLRIDSAADTKDK
jgi:hypothetical protein